MLFNSAIFALFVAISLLAWYSLSILLLKCNRQSVLARSLRGSIIVICLLIISLLFYGFWNQLCLILIIWIALVDFWVANWIFRSNSQGQRRFFLWVSLCNSIGILIFFKYGHFIAENWAIVLGLPNATLGSFWSQWLLPVGISFYTFQSVSYVVDVYRKELHPESKFLSYLLFLSFFPQLVAGPIVTAKSFLPQIRRPMDLTRIPIIFGGFLILLGLFKKMVLADHLAEVVDLVFAHPSEMSSRSLWVGMFSYSFQIYCDFSGYTDIAQGTALLFGFRLPENFRMPYLASGFSLFWTRWHISLSQWLRNYLYIPLGGNRMGTFFTYRNLILVMAIGGLWHGASWNFVFWGIGHGGFLVLERWVGNRFPSLSMYVPKLFKILFTFIVVSLLWIFFRSANFTDSLCYLQGIFAKKEGFLLPYSLEMKFVYCFSFLILGHIFGLFFFQENKQMLDRFEKIQNSLRKSLFFAFLAAIVMVLIVLYAAESKPFVYFVF